MADDNLDEDLFADLYDVNDDTLAQPTQPALPSQAPASPEPVPAQPAAPAQAAPRNDVNAPVIAASSDMSMVNGLVDSSTNGNQPYIKNEYIKTENDGGYEEHEENYGPIGIKEDG